MCMCACACGIEEITKIKFASNFPLSWFERNIIYGVYHLSFCVPPVLQLRSLALALTFHIRAYYCKWHIVEYAWFWHNCNLCFDSGQSRTDALSSEPRKNIRHTYSHAIHTRWAHIQAQAYTHAGIQKCQERYQKKTPQNQQEPGKIAMSNAKREYYVPYHSPRHVYTLAFTNIFVRSQCKVYTRLRSINSVCFVFDIVVSFYSIHHTGSELDVFDLRIGGEVLWSKIDC